MAENIPSLQSETITEPVTPKLKLPKKINENLLPYMPKNVDNLNKAPIPEVTAKSWIVFNKLTNEIVDGRKMLKKLEVASLTKIMTFCVCMEVLKRN